MLKNAGLLSRRLLKSLKPDVLRFSLMSQFWKDNIVFSEDFFEGDYLLSNSFGATMIVASLTAVT